MAAGCPNIGHFPSIFPLQAFVVCQNYSPPPGYTPTMLNPLLDHKVSPSQFLNLLSIITRQTLYAVHRLQRVGRHQPSDRPFPRLWRPVGLRQRPDLQPGTRISVPPTHPEPHQSAIPAGGQRGDCNTDLIIESGALVVRWLDSGNLSMLDVTELETCHNQSALKCIESFTILL